MESQSPRGATGKLASLVVSVMDLHVRIAGQLLKGPYLPETAAGISRTTRTLLGR